MKRHKKAPPEIVSVGNVKVKIYRRTRPTTTGETREIFEVADYNSGVRTLHSFSAHDAAYREAERIAAQLAAGQFEAASMRSADAASFGRAVELLRPTGVSLEIAAATYGKAFEILGGDVIIEAAKFYAQHRIDRLKPRRVDEVVKELISARERRGKSLRYIGDLRARLTRFAEAFAVEIHNITTADVQRWLDGLKAAPQTTKNFRTVLGTLFNFAEQRGYILKGSNPVADTESVSANGGKIEIYTPKEIALLLNAAPTEFLPIVALGAFAGLRAAEAERIDWSEIDLAGGFIHVGADKAKTRSRRLVPILPNLKAWLSPITKKHGPVWTGTPDTLRDMRTATVKASGVAWKPNALRHSFISYRLAKIQNAAQVALEAGNSPFIVFKHYRELVKHRAAQAWFAVAPESSANIVPMRKGNTL